MVVDVLFPMALPFAPSYRIAEKEEEAIAVGAYVRAPVGKRTFLGVVTALHSSHGEPFSLKFITSIENHLIPISPPRIELWRWISEYYMCTMGEVMKAAILSKPPKIADMCHEPVHPPVVSQGEQPP